MSQPFDPVGVAIVGIGFGPWSASGRHAKALKQNKKMKLVTCYSRSEEKRKRFSQENGCEANQSYQAALARSDVEAIILATPNSTHAGLAIEALQSRKHVFIEKPLATTFRDCMRIKDANRSVGSVIAVGQFWRFLRRHRLLKSMIDEGKLGTLLMAEGNESVRAAMNLTENNWRWHATERELVLFNSAIHPLDTLRYLLGEVEDACGFLTKRVTQGELDDTACTSLKFKSGVLASLIATYASPRRTYLNIYGTEANAFADESGLSVMTKDAKQPESVSLTELDPIEAEQVDFAEAIRLKRKPEVDLDEGSANVAVVEALIRSFEKRRYVSISEVLEE
ncbi:MAG: Gfo/Idh/MocA family oxidoreductase [Thaumarchaeota archaeon]|nr:Gfo/Idh/MocA family oxidoreductase [Nitrososphaerota archaeon]